MILKVIQMLERKAHREATASFLTNKQSMVEQQHMMSMKLPKCTVRSFYWMVLYILSLENQIWEYYLFLKYQVIK